VAEPDLSSRFLPAARALDAAEIVPLHADAGLAHANVSAGLAAVLAYEAHVVQHLPHVDLEELRSLPDLARAAADAARDAGGEDEEAQALFDEAYALRRKLRAAALALVEAGTLTARDAQKLGKDRGAVDLAADCAALASLFERRADELGEGGPAAEDVSRAAEIGRALKARWKPAGAGRKPGPDGLSAVDRRDRLWTLLVLRHERLWAVGAYVFGHAVDEHVPALHAPVVAVRAKKKRANQEPST
jgi:hypothetical protein